MKNNKTVDEIAIELLIQAIYLRYGHDFRLYNKASLERRFKGISLRHGIDSIAKLIPAILEDGKLWESVFPGIAVTVSDFFRDPGFFESLRKNVFPELQSSKEIRIWHAGCATGQEVYSMAILLEEAGLLQRSTIFGTDFHDMVLLRSREAIYPLKEVTAAGERYHKCGGKANIEDYFTIRQDHGKVLKGLRNHITFANHNLATDYSFGLMDIIVCRNVFIYFEKKLQERVLELFADSLKDCGWLGLAAQESIDFCNTGKSFKTVDKSERIFQKRKQLDEILK